MNIGAKLRKIRLEKHMTQSEVAADKITRNMLSAIESDKASPSLDTLVYICDRLQIPVSYVLSDELDVSEYQRQKAIFKIRNLFADKHYSDCISLIEKLQIVDDEIAYILTCSHFELGVICAKNGSFVSAEKHLMLADKYSKETIYDTTLIKCKIPLYVSYVKNVNAPLLDFDKDSFYTQIANASDFEFYKYICNDLEYNYTNVLFKKHIEAKIKIKERRYYDAVKLLLEICEIKGAYEYNSYLMYCVYTDLTTCYRQVVDFENAFKYSEKRISMIEGFNS